jgi:uncharacterized protein YkwD
VLNTTRRLVPVLLAGLLLLPIAGSVSASSTELVTTEVLNRSGLDLVAKTNNQRLASGLIALRADADLMAIARARAAVMAANDAMSHVAPNGQSVFDLLTGAGVAWYGAGEIIGKNNYPTASTSVDAVIRGWLGSSSHRAIMLSTSYNYVGYGVAVSKTGYRYYAGVFVRQRDETGPWARFGTPVKRAVDATHLRVTVRWSGADTPLQVLTSGLAYYQVDWRAVGGAWHTWGVTQTSAHSATWWRGADYEVRIRARDKAGNWSTWRTIRVNL